MKALLLVALPASAMVLALTGVALADAGVTKVEPDFGETVESIPDRVRVTFGETIGPRVLSFQVTDGCGVRRENKAVIEDRTLSITLRDGEPGIWIVEFAVISSDGHDSGGQYFFTLDGRPGCPNPQTAGEIPAATPLGTTEPEPTSGSPVRLPLLIAIGAFLTAGALIVWRRWEDLD